MSLRGFAVLAACALIPACESLEHELPLETVISWPELSWQPVPPEHEEYVPDMIAVLENVVQAQQRIHEEHGRYEVDVRALGDSLLVQRTIVYITAADEYAHIAVFHAEAPGSGCIVRLGERTFARYTDDPNEMPSPAFFDFGLRLPDTAGELACMQKAPEDLRPSITQRRL